MTLTKKILPLAALLAVALPGGTALAAPKSKFRFSAATYVTQEGGSVQVTVTRQARHGHSRINQGSSVDWSIAGGSATSGVDYDTDIAQGTLTFASGETTKVITFNTHQDTDIEGLEAVNLKLSAPSRNALITSPRSAQVLIADDDGPTQIQLAPATQSVNEAAGGADVFAVRSGDITGVSSAHVATSNGTATAGSDYTAVPDTTLTYAPGDFSKTVHVAINNDSQIEDPETFSVDLSNVTGATTGNPHASVTIVDNDSAPVFALDASGYEVNENGSVDLTVLRLGSSTGALVPDSDVFDVNWTTTDGTATNPADYLPADDQQLEFDSSDDAETITISANGATEIGLVDDALVEGDETFGLSLVSAANERAGGPAPSIGSPSSATVTIHDNDAAASNGSPTGGGTGTGAGTDATGGGGVQSVLGARQANCALTIKGLKKQKLVKQKALKLTVKSLRACNVTLTATIKQLKPKSKKRGAQIVRALVFKGKKASLTLQPGKAKTVKVKFAKKTLKAISKALQARKALVATVVVTSKNSASSSTRKTLRITIRR